MEFVSNYKSCLKQELNMQDLKREISFWKRMNLFSVHTVYAEEVWKRNNQRVLLDLCPSKTGAGKIQEYSNIIIFKKLLLQNVFCSKYNAKSALSNSFGLKSVFESLSCGSSLAPRASVFWCGETFFHREFWLAYYSYSFCLLWLARMTTVVLISRNRSDYDVINLDVHLVTTDMHNQFIPINKFSSFPRIQIGWSRENLLGVSLSLQWA